MKQDDEILELGEKRAKELNFQSHNPAYWPAAMNLNQQMYRASDIHRLLGEGLSMHDRPREKGTWVHQGEFRFCEKTGLLIGVKPIRQESDEHRMLRRVLRKFVEAYFKGDDIIGPATEAKKLLEEE